MDMQKQREAFDLWFKTTTTYKTLQDFIYTHQPSIKSVFAKKNGRAYLNDCVQIAWEAWQAAKASAVPEGYCVVPKEPTEEMIYAGYESKTYVDNLAVNYKAMIEAVQEG